MKILVLGGTVFLGRHLVQAALGRGHEVTLFNRGRTNPGLFPDVEKIRGDRASDLGALRGRSWDAVVDPSGYVPRIVRASAEALRGSVEHYTFISSISVYAEPLAAGADENAPVETLEDETNEEVREHYGALKALCERAAEAAMPGRALNVRAGLIVGPNDPTGRFTYWPNRIAEGGEVLAPGDPERPVQFIDVRDLAGWIVRAAEARIAGAFNVTGPAPAPIAMRAALDAVNRAVGGAARFVWVPDAFLKERGASPWMEIPLWLERDAAGILAVSVERARAAGLSCRPVGETARDTLAWSRSAPAAEVWRADVGLAREKERAILEAWRSTGEGEGR